MNLVAQESPVLSERGCALVLSREAGAAELIGASALLVNPYDVTATAEALHAGLCMPADGRRRRSGGDRPGLSGNATIVRGKALRFTMTLLS